MPHIDDGTLHALLDGALRAMEPDMADIAEAHLAECAECRARAAEAAGLRGRADEILAVLEPGVTPDFDEVLVRAGAAGGPDGQGAPVASDAPGASGPPRVPRSPLARQARWTRRLAWAATIVIALGTGYLIRDRIDTTVPGPATERVLSSDRFEAADGATEGAADGATDVALPGGARSDGTLPEGAFLQEQAAPAEGEAPARTAPGQAAPGTNAAREPAVREPAAREAPTQSAQRFMTREGIARPATPVLDADADGARQIVGDEGVAMENMVVTPVPSVVREAGQPRPGAASGAAGVAAGAAPGSEPRVVDPADVEALLGVPFLVLDGAEVTLAVLEEDAAGAVVVSTQRLEDGIVIRVSQRRAEPPAPLGAPAAPTEAADAPAEAPEVAANRDPAAVALRARETMRAAAQAAAAAPAPPVEEETAPRLYSVRVETGESVLVLEGPLRPMALRLLGAGLAPYRR